MTFVSHTVLAGFIIIVCFSVCCRGYSYLQPVKFGDGICLDDDWVEHEVGSVWYDTAKCEQLECVYYGDILYIQGYGCGKIGHPKGCWLISGKGVNYPSCCPQVQCSEGIIW
ncbi:unnamed protein product [Larinioides sclopetarius]|uniref:Single domain-containing protein n=1 Tax=Larinioides sclopetarius TaxID=280406 RepID=A0AAV1ZW73_9ARAC